MNLRGSSTPFSPALFTYEGIQYQNIAPAVMEEAHLEYAKAITPYTEAEGVRMITCLFGFDRGGKLVQRSTAAKAARGSMVRWCAEQGIDNVADLRAFNIGGYRYCGDMSTKDVFFFTL